MIAGSVPRRRNEFNQRHEMRRVHGMGDEKPLPPWRVLGEGRSGNAGARTSNDRVIPDQGADGFRDGALLLHALEYRFLNVVDVADRGAQVLDHGDARTNGVHAVSQAGFRHVLEACANPTRRASWPTDFIIASFAIRFS
jgi:hypothetical protein